MASSKAPSSNSIQSYIKLISQLKPTTSTTDHFVPYHRHWVDGNTQKDIGHIIRVMTWNVLAQGICPQLLENTARTLYDNYY